MGQKHAKLKQDIVDELVAQTSFTEFEIQDWYKGFMKECPAGHLNLDEFKRIYTQFFPYGEATRFAKHVFRSFDLNHDGLIDFREFVLSLNVTSRADVTQKLQWAFSVYDLDNDGFISRQDLLEVLEAIYAMIGTTVKFPFDESTPEKRVCKIFDLMDLDKDDRLSMDEFSQGIKNDPLLMRFLTSNSTNCEQNPNELGLRTANAAMTADSNEPDPATRKIKHSKLASSTIPDEAVGQLVQNSLENGTIS